jgi:hypothetical protein
MAPIYGNLAENVRQSPGICVNINPAPKYAMFSLLDAYAGMTVIVSLYLSEARGHKRAPNRRDRRMAVQIFNSHPTLWRERSVVEQDRSRWGRQFCGACIRINLPKIVGILQE